MPYSRSPGNHHQSALHTILPRLFGILVLSLCLCACGPDAPATMAELKARGELRVAVLAEHLPPSGSHEVSAELWLAQTYAEHLGLRLQLLISTNAGEQLAAVSTNAADLALGVPQTMTEQAGLDASASYRQDRYVLVSKFVDKPVNDLSKLQRELRVVAGSGAAARLLHLHKSGKALRWTQAQTSTSDLLADIDDGALAYALLSAGDYYALRPLFPHLDVRMRLKDSEALVCATAPGSELQPDLEQFFANEELVEKIKSTIARWQQPLQHLASADYQALTLASQQQLPALRPQFMAAADAQLPWRLLAALAWQESHWQSDATSPTGVAGVMMLTEETAARMQVNDRRDAGQSIRGGADYLRELLSKMPERVNDDDKLWFALAAYNIGFMHLEDARILTQKNGDDPDHWMAVKKYLPMLRDPAVHETTRYGYARGDESVQFVSRIQRYYAALHWLPETLDARSRQRFNLDQEIDTELAQKKTPDAVLPAVTQTESKSVVEAAAGSN